LLYNLAMNEGLQFKDNQLADQLEGSEEKLGLEPVSKSDFAKEVEEDFSKFDDSIIKEVFPERPESENSNEDDHNNEEEKKLSPEEMSYFENIIENADTALLMKYI
jgi:hypothetical protein